MSYSNEAAFYDIIDDYALIEASFLEQYGIRLSEVNMSWQEFTDLLSCISADTPLGRVVAIRSETDTEIISRFTKPQRAIYEEWHGRAAAGNIDDLFALFRQEAGHDR